MQFGNHPGQRRKTFVRFRHAQPKTRPAGADSVFEARFAGRRKHDVAIILYQIVPPVMQRRHGHVTQHPSSDHMIVCAFAPSKSCEMGPSSIRYRLLRQRQRITPRALERLAELEDFMIEIRSFDGIFPRGARGGCNKDYMILLLANEGIDRHSARSQLSECFHQAFSFPHVEDFRCARLHTRFFRQFVESFRNA